VVRLDQVRLAGGGAGRFDDVRVDRALREEIGVVVLARLFLEDLDEQVADRLDIYPLSGDKKMAGRHLRPGKPGLRSRAG